jgi:molecular chaperone DnaK (HSP70)
LAGPVTVLENSSYAGDARIDDVPPGQNRFISYGIDLNVLVDSDGQEEGRVPNAIRSAKISQGVLEVVTRRQLSQTYKVQNKGDVAKTVIIEHPRMPDWHVVEPAKEEETTEDVHRLRLRVEPHKTQSLVVRTEGDSTSRTEILTSKVDDLVFYTRDGVLPSNVRTGLQKAVVLKAALTDTQSQIDQRKKEIADVTAEQQRLRENMKTVAQNTEYYTRLLTKLNDQETHIEQLQKEIAEAVKTQTKQKKELEEYISKLEL